MDTVETPFGRVEEILGGSASYFSYAASLLAPVQLVGVGGEDFPEEHVEEFRRRAIDVAGLVRESGRTFRWWGRYRGAMNVAETLDVQLNVFGEFQPVVPVEYRDTEFVFLANASPQVQLDVRRQVPGARLVMADTMNFWIENERDGLLALLAEVDGVVVNDQEARQLTGVGNLILAAREILGLGPRLVVVKKGEHGAMLVTETDLFMVPAYPTTVVKDPTGAGDSFNAGFLHAHLQGADLAEWLDLGSACGALSTRGAGGTTSQASLQEAKDFIRSARRREA